MLWWWDYFFAKCRDFLGSCNHCEVARQPAFMHACACVCVLSVSCFSPTVLKQMQVVGELKTRHCECLAIFGSCVKDWQAMYFFHIQTWKLSNSTTVLVSDPTVVVELSASPTGTWRANISPSLLWIEQLCPKNRLDPRVVFLSDYMWCHPWLLLVAAHQL